MCTINGMTFCAPPCILQDDTWSLQYQIHFTIMLLSSVWCPSFKFPHKNPIGTSFLPHVCHMPCPPHLSSRTSQTMEFNFHAEQ